MVKLIAVAAFALTVTSSAQSMSPAPVHQPDSLITQVAAGCGAGRTRVNGVCVARTTNAKPAAPSVGVELALLADCMMNCGCRAKKRSSFLGVFHFERLKIRNN